MGNGFENGIGISNGTPYSHTHAKSSSTSSSSLSSSSPSLSSSSVRRRGGRVGTTQSKLAHPSSASPVYKLASAFQEHLHLPDPTPVYVTMGTIAGNMMTGPPIWMMLVGSSSCGKTALLKSLLKIHRVRAVSSIKGEAALLSGVKAKERSKESTGGVLRELGDRGCLAFMDFTGVLSKSKEAVAEMCGIFRDLYDGCWSRDIGGEGGMHYEHTGIVSMIAGVTHAIDRHHEVSELGERCVYYRFPITDGYQEGIKVAQATEPDLYNEQRQDLVKAMFDHVGLRFEDACVRRKIDLSEADRLVSLAQFGALARTSIPRDFRTRQIIDIASPEVCTRMTGELTQLYLGMEAIGVDREDMWKSVNKVALDSMPLARRMILQTVMDGEARRGVGAICERVRVSDAVVRRVVEDLELLGLARRTTSTTSTNGNGGNGNGNGSGGGWRLTEWAHERLEKAGVMKAGEEAVVAGSSDED